RFVEKKWQAHRWWSHAGIALGYALAYLGIAETLSNAPWPFAAGLRIACLLLVPYRYWPALVVGEAVPLAYLNVGHAADFGSTWSLLASVPPIVLAMPVAWWFRERAALFPARDLVDVKKLLCFVLALSLLWASTRYAILLTVQKANGLYHPKAGTAFSFFINVYMVLLVVTPWVVMVRIHSHRFPQLPAWKANVTGPAVRDAFIAVLSFAVLAVLHHLVPQPIKPAVALVLFFPVMGLTLKHGWRASVLGGTLCLISISFLVELQPDPNTQQIQAVLAFTITCLYLFGARLSMQMRLLDQFQRESYQTQQVAQKSLAFGEQRLQQTSQALECVAGALRMDYVRVLQRFVPADARDDYGKDFLDVQKNVYHLAESIHPS
ncbi:MAG TPA: MASE1 domain-containing protein, partial [Candidatus Saccharimonadales bacterium]|nr:MASE1 domain-containing protein [Candidatus Saccharimonadales bacterium]